MGIWIRYTKYDFSEPKQVSLDDYNQLRNNFQGFVNATTKPEKELFFKNYIFKIFLTPIMFLLCFYTYQNIVDTNEDLGWLVSFLIFGFIAIKGFGYIFSALSIWDNNQSKKRYYKRIRELIDNSTDYNNFQQRLATWNKKQDLGFTGRLTYKILMSLRGKND